MMIAAGTTLVGDGRTRARRSAFRVSRRSLRCRTDAALALRRDRGVVTSETVELVHREALIPLAGGALPADVVTPAAPLGAVVFAHGSGSGRRSPRNLQVARHLNVRGLATLLFDLLTPEEAAERANVFDVPLLVSRLERATSWLLSEPEGLHVPVGYFGASTGAAAALWAAAELGDTVRAVVSRGGRPDMAMPRLGEVRAPTLLIVGGADELVLELNREAGKRLRCEWELAVVPGAGHLFEEPGALERVAELASGWFVRRLPG
jgi:dienelactone hydrolase